MKTIICILAASLLLSGCAMFEEAYFADREFGHAQATTWDKQVAFPDYRYAASVPEGMPGVHSEEIMKTYNNSFTKRTEEKIEVMDFGEVGD